MSGRPPAGRPRPNVIVVLIDTMRADAIDLEHEGGGSMPYLSSLARSATCFTQASSAAPWTLPSMMSLFTARLPHSHGVTWTDLGAPALQGLATWAEILAAQGYETAAFVGAVFPGAARGLLQGFQHVEEDYAFQGTQVLLDAWKAKRDPKRPFFLLLHTYEAHDPYGRANHAWPSRAAPHLEEARKALLALGDDPPPHEVTRRMLLDAATRDVVQREATFARLATLNVRYQWSGWGQEPRPDLARDLERAYREGLTWVDGGLRDTFAYLEREGLLHDALWMITGDHGEAFGEHGMLLHGRLLHDELLRVPLVVHGPAPFDKPQRIDASVGLTDLLPTLCDLLGLPAPDDAVGTSLLPLVVPSCRGHLVEAEETRTAAQTAGESVAVLGSVRTAARKLIASYEMRDGSYREEYYDLESDPGERKNLAGADGLAPDLSADPIFSRAVERLRERLWAASARTGEAQAHHDLLTNLKPIVRPRPPSPAPPR